MSLPPAAPASGGAGGRARRWRRDVRARLAAGAQRSRDAVGPALWLALACGVAYWLAIVLLGHPYPFFAAVAATSALGFSPDVMPRRVGEVALGVTVGVGMGEVIQMWWGSGPVQTGAVVALAVLIGKLLSPSPVLTTQTVVQSIVVLGLPALAVTGGGPVGRWTEALLGGAVALVFSLFIPKDPRRRPRQLARDVLTSVSRMLALVATSLREGAGAPAQEALERGRAMQASLLAFEDAAVAAGSTSRISPAWRHHAAALGRLVHLSEMSDRAVRTTRVLARRAATLEGYTDPDLAARVDALGTAAARLAQAVATGADLAPARETLLKVSGTLGLAAERSPVRHTLISLLRSIAFDLARSAGASEREASRALG